MERLTGYPVTRDPVYQIFTRWRARVVALVSGGSSHTAAYRWVLASFLLPGLVGSKSDESTFLFMPQIVRGLLGFVLIFDIYTCISN